MRVAPSETVAGHRRGSILLERLLGGAPLVSSRLRRWVLAVSILAVGCVAGFGFAVRHSTRPWLFDATVDHFLGRSSGLEYRVAVVLSNAGDPGVFLTITALVALTLFLLRDYRAAVAAVVSVGLALVLVEDVLKPFFDRHHGTYPGGPTFPSGHAAVALALAGAVTLAAAADRPLGRLLGPLGRRLLVVVVLAVACSIGLAMVVLQFHYMSDVVAGVPLGLAVSGCTAVALDAVADHWQSSKQRRALAT